MKSNLTSDERLQLNGLRELSARLASNPLLVQASTGNTSVKVDDVLWIKASGKWLVQSGDEDFLVPVRLIRSRRALRDYSAAVENLTEFIDGRGASIETAMHASLPYRVVVHVHSVATIAWTIREDAPHQLTSRLSGLRWAWIPYTPSGAPLARQIENALHRDPETNVFVLANHGLVVCGESFASAESLLAQVEERLAVQPRRAPEPKYRRLEEIASGSKWNIPTRTGLHALATDPVARRILAGGVLYPCQAIFLPGTIKAGSHNAICPRSQPFLLLEGDGVLVSDFMSRAEGEMFAGLANIVQRVDADARLHYLTPSEVQDVLGVGAESYRRSAGRSMERDTVMSHSA